MKKVHLPMCGIGPLHMAALTKHLYASHYLCFLDLSGNEIGDQGADALAQLIRGHHTAQDDHLSIPPIEHLDISSCGFECDGMTKLLQALASRHHVFHFIDLSNNQIGPNNDAALQAIANISVIHLCLNYCHLKTSWSSSLFQILAHRSITHVGHPSSETLSRETPGMARAKTHFYFGAQANSDDPIANGYSHIESRVRGKFVVQKQLEELYRQSFPTRPFNYVA
eukprot:scaffold2421_cov171-Ochromonas_danica.AAC.5